MYHKPVLLKESIEGLAIQKDGIYVDATFGGGGHAREILKPLTKGRLLAFDQDKDALANAFEDERLTLINANFRYVKNFLQLYQQTQVDGILADLGISSHQIDMPGRGFSTRFEGELDMRMNQKQPLTAKEVLNKYPEESLLKIFKDYGELKNAKEIASLIANAREQGPLTTNMQLKQILASCTVAHKENKFFAQVFQALRIEVNEELESLQEFLQQTLQLLKPGARLVIISYHSLEDRLIKNFMKSGNFQGILNKDFYGKPELFFKLINKKPIVASDEERRDNPRARSAKLRIAERL